MTEHQPTLLDDLDKTPVGHAPIEQPLSDGRAAKQRKRRTALAGAVAGTALVLGGGTIAVQALPGTSDRSTEDRLVADASHDPDQRNDGVRGGTRLVGIGKVAITVPAEWETNAASCNTPVRDTYYYPYPQDCIHYAVRNVSSVAIADRPFSEAGIRLDGLSPGGELGGHEVMQSAATCELSDPGACAQTFVVPDLDAYFHATVQTEDGGEAALDDIRESLTLLAEDQVVVPFLPYGDEEEVVTALNLVGFTVALESATCPPTAGCVAGVSGIEPAVGTVVPIGSTVTVTVIEN